MGRVGMSTSGKYIKVKTHVEVKSHELVARKFKSYLAAAVDKSDTRLPRLTLTLLLRCCCWTPNCMEHSWERATQQPWQQLAALLVMPCMRSKTAKSEFSQLAASQGLSRAAL
jgi:hypothetical protein